MNRATGDFWKDWDTEDAAGVSPDRLRSATEESIAHIVQQARQILEIVPGERRLMPSFGCRIHQLDTVQTPLEKNTGAARIEEALERWAPTLAGFVFDSSYQRLGVASTWPIDVDEPPLHNTTTFPAVRGAAHEENF